jgi:hypothetical protein
MEELQSSEVLDREILEDARKKAFTILKGADDAAAAAEAAWKKRTGKELEALKVTYAARLDAARSEIMAALPLDERRLRSEWAQRLLTQAMQTFLASLSRERLLAILGAELRRCLAALDAKAISDARALARGLSETEAKALLIQTEYLAGLSIPINLNDDDFTHGGRFPGLCITSPAARVTVSVDGAAETLLEERRAELAAALLGEEALND